MQYLSGTITYGMLLSPENPLTHISLRANNNFDWASDPDDRRLTSGNPDDKRLTSGTCIYLYPNLMQTVQAMKMSFKPQLIQLHNCYGFNFSFQNFILTITLRPCFLTNLSVVLISHNHVIHARIKYIELDIHFLEKA